MKSINSIINSVVAASFNQDLALLLKMKDPTLIPK
ncbi:hypothetical protein FAM21834_01557 [Lentilactobacillus parabuchneri]|uniref:Uncharacterized protein n=1 Tax=Lentilactobacillus parabuchneri TaxID=152331 RepID=A0A1X1FEB3_9LACO|nr:hypothetical protein FAM21731_01498 [Lentilactobacillus parabuchneri]ORM91542.1 hypothetical protein FAM21809_01529 [Lentilactobacillus parabuchneri]ORN00516.1 hypothetical protein FAM21823_01534 [Lentilactobacillus parabuchneri]ORN04521.1 hypothetical protein FAM21829_01334 [Lentilactobacillus parabuchneri]ORN08257.1 hypothetical protein FAM23163_01340 [Lentilactobacillus parabuchneri]